MSDERPNVTTKFTNNSRAPQGIHVVAEAGAKQIVLLKPRESQVLTVAASEMDHLAKLPFLGIEGVERKVGGVLGQPTTLSADTTDLQAQLTTITGERDQLKADLEAVTSERDALRAAADAEKEPVPAFTTKHKGGGSYSIFDADGNEVVKKLSADDVDVFSAMSDDDKAAYVAENKDKAE